MGETPPPPINKIEKIKAAPKAKPVFENRKGGPKKQREGAAGLQEMGESLKEKSDYLARTLAGNIKPEEVAAVKKRREKTRRQNGIRGLDAEILETAHGELQLALRQGVDVTHIDAALARELGTIESTRQFEFYVVMTGRVVPLGDRTRFQKAMDTLTALIPENFSRMAPEEQAKHAARIATVLQKQYSVSLTAREVEDHIQEYLFSMGSVDVMEQLLASREFRQAFAANKTADNSTRAFREALEHATPEARKLYEEYVAIWEGDSFKDFWGSAEGGVEAVFANLAPASEAVQAAAKSELLADGVAFTAASGNMGQLRLGNFAREAKIFEAEGAPKIVISGGDREDIGPLDPKEVRQAMENLVLDQYFSQKFLEFAPPQASEGPRAVNMAKMAPIIRAFLPNASQEIEGALQAEQRIVVTSLAYLMAMPSEPPYRTLQEKTQFLAEVSKDAQKLDRAKRLLAPAAERDFFAKFTIKEFSEKLA